VPDITWKIKAKDESASGFESFTRRLKTMRGEERVSGATTFESMLKGGPEGLLKMAGVGLGASIIQSVVGQLKGLSESVKKNVTGMRMGTQTMGDTVEGMMGSLPFGIGEGWELGRNIREIFTGDEAKAQFSEHQEKLESELSRQRFTMIKAMTLDRRSMQEKIYQSEALGVSGGVQTQAARIRALQFSGKSELQQSQDKIKANYEKLSRNAEDQLDAANGVLRGGWHKFVMGWSSFNAKYGLGGDKGMLEQSENQLDVMARADQKHAYQSILDLAKEKKTALTQDESDRVKIAQDQLANLKMEDQNKVQSMNTGLGGRIGAMGTSDASRKLAYQLQMGQFDYTTRQQLKAIGGDTEILDQYMKLAMSPNQMAIATGTGPGPLALAGASGLAPGTKGYGANAQEAWNIHRGAMGDNATIESLLKQILDSLNNGSPAGMGQQRE
jgi:hypothetical protein